MAFRYFKIKKANHLKPPSWLKRQRYKGYISTLRDNRAEGLTSVGQYTPMVAVNGQSQLQQLKIFIALVLILDLPYATALLSLSLLVNWYTQFSDYSNNQPPFIESTYLSDSSKSNLSDSAYFMKTFNGYYHSAVEIVHALLENCHHPSANPRKVALIEFSTALEQFSLMQNSIAETTAHFSQYKSCVFTAGEHPLNFNLMRPVFSFPDDIRALEIDEIISLTKDLTEHTTMLESYFANQFKGIDHLVRANTSTSKKKDNNSDYTSRKFHH